jgi:RecA/RadA recombinase
MPKRVQVEEVRQAILSRSTCRFSDQVEFLPTGSSCLNLISSGRINGGGFPRARVINLVGDGSSGKTLVALEFMAAVYWDFMRGALAKSDLFPKTKRLFLVYNNAEGVMDFDIGNMYGDQFYEAVEWISYDTVERFGADFFSRVKSAKSGDTIIYVVDSWDAMDSDEDKEKFSKDIDRAIKGKAPETGTYSLGKQKYASKRFFKKVCADVQTTGADMTLIIISQVRDRIGITFGEKKTRVGGAALDFYTHLVIWLREKSKLKMTRLGQERVYGIDVQARVKRSKVWKPFREIGFKIIFDYGIEDVESLMDFYFGPKKSPLIWKNDSYKRPELIELFHTSKIEREDLRKAVQDLWDEVETRIAPTRRKYDD